MPKALSSSEQYSTKVVGTSFCQENLIRVCGPKKAASVELEVPAELVLENDNQADVNAVAVLVDGLKIGYLPKREAMIHRIFIHGSDYIKDRLICIGKISGGWDNGYGNCGHYGVAVELPYKAGLDILSNYLHATLKVYDLKVEIPQHKTEDLLSCPCN
jgi:hypothetical protein